MMPEWASNVITLLIGGIVSGTGVGAWVAYRKERRETRLAPVAQEQAQANLAEQLQQLTQHVVSNVRAEMKIQDERHKQELEDQEARHTRQLTGLRRQLDLVNQDRAIDAERIEMLETALHDAGLPLPVYARRVQTTRDQPPLG